MNIQVTTKATTAVAYAIIFLSVSSFGQSLTWKLAVAPAQPGQISVCSSFDGTKLAAVSSNNGIYISTNSGAHWTQIPMSANWSCIACSSDGTKLVAAAQPGSIYVSTNSGATWSVAGAPVEMWEAVASSSDGTRLVAATDGGYLTSTNGGIYVSMDSGNTWVNVGPTYYAGSYNAVYDWQAVASSSDGTKLVAAVNGGPVFTSQNSGGTWTQTTAPNAANWSSVASSTNGVQLEAAAPNGVVYRSGNSGANWTDISGTNDLGGWVSVASSANGTNLLVASDAGIYCSTNAGNTWTSTSAPRLEWRSLASSFDGTKVVAATLNPEEIWIGQSSPLYPVLKIAQTPTNAVILSADNLVIGHSYQLQVANGMVGWTPFGAAFSATNTTLTPVAIWNESKTNQMFFRLLMSQ